LTWNYLHIFIMLLWRNKHSCTRLESIFHVWMQIGRGFKIALFINKHPITTMKTMKILSLALFLISSLMLYTCSPKDSGDSKDLAEEQNEEKFDDKKTENDAEFVVDAADGGMLEVQLAELAMKTSTSEEVKNYAKMILTDHSKTNTELKTIAEKKNITLPIAMSDKNQKRYDDLADKTGEDFDKAYCKLMVDDHQEDIKEFKKQADDGTDPELKSWASEKVATLEHHLVTAEEMESKRN